MDGQTTPAPLDTNLGGPSPINPRKRPRATREGSTYARKRAVAACELCRSRKAKCDNQRPCGNCVSFGANCVFKDRGNDYSSFDNASLAILDRVNYAVQLLEHSASLRPALSNDQPQPSPYGTPSNGAPQTPFSDLQPGVQGVENRNEVLVDKLSVNTRCACTHIIEWPIFAGRVKPSSVNPALYGNEIPQVQSMWAQTPAVRIDEGEVASLVQTFLQNVHIKNPILERNELLKSARIVAEDGFKWDSSSCLVLITCALGSISAVWEVAIPHSTECSLSDTSSHASAEAYYTAARKRIALLGNTIESIQCWFLLGVFEMYAMKPLTAWASFSRACTLLELRLYTQRQHSHQDCSRAERRLYWSCLKSEAELREEFDLPEPGLARIDHPYVLPTPPESTSNPANGFGNADPTWETVNEQSWYYYLSDIAYRRITNRTIAALYNKSPENWLQATMSRLYNIAEELDAQVLQWWDTIPGSPKPTCNADTDELTYMLYLNYADLRERIWRPFVYIATHSERTAPSGLVKDGASKCISMSLDMLENAMLKHRHHGCWQTIRCMFSKALVILAAAKGGRVELPQLWRRRIERFQTYMEYWQQEAPDIRAANEALTALMEFVDD